MFPDDEYSLDPVPFWFARSELLADLWHAELRILIRSLADNPDLLKLFDVPDATLAQRSAGFVLLAHREVLSMIDETLVGRYEESPCLDDLESRAFYSTANLVPADAPAWVVEMHNVVTLLPDRILQALPQPLRKQAFDQNNPAQAAALPSLSTVEQIQSLVAGVFEQQLRRLTGRWSVASIPPGQNQQSPASQAAGLKGTEGLVRKTDLSRYSQFMCNLTEKQELAFRLRVEYGLKLTEVASRMGIDRKTAYEHIKAAIKKIDQARSSEKRNAKRAKNPDF